MRFGSMIVLALVATAAMSPEDRGPGLAGTRAGEAMVYPATRFDRVALGTGAGMDVRVGPAWTVRASGPDAAFRDLRVTHDRGTLHVERRYRGVRGNPELERQVRVAVTMPHIAGASLGGAGSIHIDRVQGDGFDAALGGSGRIAIDRMAVRRGDVSIGGSGRVTAAGRAESLRVNLGGSGAFDAPALAAGHAAISSTGSGSVRARVSGDATVSAVGSGEADLGPGARCTVTRMGSARVRCGG